MEQHSGQAGKLSPTHLNQLFDILKAQGYQLIGPKLVGQSITYDEIQALSDLPQGWGDRQEKGFYRIEKRQDNAYFGYNIGSRSFKNYLFPPREQTLTIKTTQPITVQPAEKVAKLALIGVRACELHAIQIQDKVFIQSPHTDTRYQKRREQAFIVTLNCHTAAKTCFCTSMKTGPKVEQGYDLNLSEILTAEEHYFICEVGSEKGQAVWDALDRSGLTETDWQRKSDMLEKTAQQITRKLDTKDIKEKLYARHEHAHWDEVASRCINCTNCTLACPTCFCSRNETTSDLTNENVTQHKVWDSCFSQEYSYVHDSFVRESSKSRYRQWMTHKLASWYDQFDTSGCVGCGRCIAWCPVGIDITEEYANLMKDDHEDKTN